MSKTSTYASEDGDNDHDVAEDTESATGKRYLIHAVKRLYIVTGTALDAGEQVGELVSQGFEVSVAPQ